LRRKRSISEIADAIDRGAIVRSPEARRRAGWIGAIADRIEAEQAIERAEAIEAARGAGASVDHSDWRTALNFEMAKLRSEFELRFAALEARISKRLGET
jgi:hypothetical protein